MRISIVVDVEPVVGAFTRAWSRMRTLIATAVGVDADEANRMRVGRAVKFEAEVLGQWHTVAHDTKINMEEYAKLDRLYGMARHLRLTAPANLVRIQRG